MSMLDEISGIMKHKKIVLPVVAIVIILLLVVFVGPKLTGFTVYSDNLDICEDELSACKSNSNDLSTSKTTLESSLSETKKSMSSKESELHQLQAELNHETGRLSENYDIVIEKLNLLADNSARNICCKKKYDNNEINSFNIEDNSIICAVDGTFALNCNFDD